MIQTRAWQVKSIRETKSLFIEQLFKKRIPKILFSNYDPFFKLETFGKLYYGVLPTIAGIIAGCNLDVRERVSRIISNT